MPRAVTPKSTVQSPQRLENERGDRIISSGSADSDSASLISSEFEVEVVTPLRQVTGDGVHQSLMEGEFSRVTENSNKTTLMNPINKNLLFCEWVSNQRNNNKRLERSGVVTEGAMHQPHSNMQVRCESCNYSCSLVYEKRNSGCLEFLFFDGKLIVV